ncbi:MAG TPA: ion channel [Kofleriaceae bacterium]|nr:ion channel [Kofleriaceae bacterium]
MSNRPSSTSIQRADYVIRVVGARATPLRDFYHLVLSHSWGLTFAVIAGVFLAVNCVFALGYLAVGGIAHARAGSFADAFFFSVQTFGTIGYGNYYPESAAANVLVAAESLAALTLVALATGLVFAKFSRPTARIVFAKQIVISPMNSVPTLAFRVGNERGNQIVDAKIRVVLVRTEKTTEGTVFYRMLDLKLTRDRSISLQRSWTVMHTIDADSPLAGATPASFVEQEVELLVMVLGYDDTTMQAVHANHRYLAPDVVWGARHCDILSEDPDGDVTLDLRRFHHIEPTPAQDAFPYSLGPSSRD